MLYPIIFAVCLVLDLLNTFLTTAIVKNQAIRSTILTGLAYLFGMLTIILVVHSNWCLIPAVLGKMAGTYIAVKISGSGRSAD